MGQYNFDKYNNEEPVQTDWISLLDETQKRLYAFLEKLEQRMQELADAAVPELEALKSEDERAYGNMLNGVKGQLNAVRDKAQKTYDEKVEDVYDQIQRNINVLHPQYSHLRDFRTYCSARFHQQFDGIYNKYQDQLDSTTYTDYEVLYQRIVDEYEAVKNKFNCHQCGGKISLEKIYFTVSHLTCPTCQTKNTFQPSTLAQGLEHIGRGLAEQRTKPLLEKYYNAQHHERELYHQAHELKLKSYSIQHLTKKELLLKQISDLENLRKEMEKKTPELYQQYQRAMFDEWKTLVPDLAEQTENFYQNLQKRKF